MTIQQTLKNIRSDQALERIRDSIDKAHEQGQALRLAPSPREKAPEPEHIRRLRDQANRLYGKIRPYRTPMLCRYAQPGPQGWEARWDKGLNVNHAATRTSFKIAITVGAMQKELTDPAIPWQERLQPVGNTALVLAAPEAPSAGWIIQPDGQVLDSHFCPTCYAVRQVREIGGKLHYFVQRGGKAIPDANAPTAQAAWALAVSHYGGEA